MERNLESPKSKDIPEVSYPKTPYNVRARVKKQMMELAEEDEQSSFDDSDQDSVIDSESTSDEFNNEANPKTPRNLTLNSIEKKQTNGKEYYFDAENYFTKNSSKKIVTSNNTLDMLKTARLDQSQLQKLLEKYKNNGHNLELLANYNRKNFCKWLLLLKGGFNLLLYGLGSKLKLLAEFQEEFSKNSPVVLVNGFFPSLTFKNILDSILGEVLESPRNVTSNNYQEACNFISEILSRNQKQLYLIINNIDGINLRNMKTQNALAKLAEIDNLHLIATIDHINAPLMWDQNRLSKFNFVWWDVTSFELYLKETSFEDSMMIQRSRTLALSSLNNVFMSLTKNAKSIYLLIVRYQLTNKKNQNYEGILFKDLYWSCREAFLVSSDLALRSQLTEFVDHKMIKFKRSTSGGEHLIIPLANNLLQQFLDEQTLP